MRILIGVIKGHFIRKWFYILPILIVVSCDEKRVPQEKLPDTTNVAKDSFRILESAEKPMTKQSSFEPLGDSLTYIYLSQLPQLPLPFTISTEKTPPHTNTDGMNEDIVDQLMVLGSPYGKLIERTNYTVVVHTVPTDIWFPILYTMDFNGKVIDTLNAFECGGSDADYTCAEYFSVSKDGLIEFTDSTYHWELDPVGNRIKSSEKLDVTYKTYIISDRGIFETFETGD